ncbi:acyltransferase [Yersinia vastinensis]|uniref:acyltransferase n=1 Tax=Yersinia vastinensis TaxID=2890318 RepID=UPI0039A349AF
MELSNIRGVAIILVVMIHCASVGFAKYSDDWWIAATLDAFSRCCVPLFLMVSGALLVTKNEIISIFFKKRVSRIFPPLIFWGVIYVFFSSIFLGNKLLIENFISIFYKVSYKHLWYLYFIIGIYTLIPILSKWYIASSLNEKIFYATLWFIVNLIFQFNQARIFVNSYGLITFVSLFGYLILGALLFELSQLNKLKYGNYFNLILYVTISILISFTSYLAYKSSGSISIVYLGYLSPLIILQSVFIFLFLCRFKFNSKTMNFLSNNSLGIYCVHMMVIAITLNYLKIYDIHMIYKIILLFAITISISSLIVFLMRKYSLLRLVV